MDSADPNRPDVDQDGDKHISLNDVMSFLQGMQSDQSKTEKRLSQLSNKVNDLYDYEDYDEDKLLRNDGEGDPSLGHTNDNGEYDCDDNHEVNNNTNEPPAKKQKTTESGECSNQGSDSSSVFKGLSEKFKIKEKIVKPVDSELADIVNVLFFNGIPESKLSDLLKSVNIENCNMLTKTRVNQLIWDLLSDYTRGEENKTQYKQGLVIKAAMLITKMFDKLDIFRKDNENFPTNIIELGTDALGLLEHFNRLTNLSRRDLHRPDLSNEYFHLCSSSVPYTYFYMEMTYLKKYQTSILSTELVKE